MEQAKKFGTFSGVFTPSILTILGVIMYMRLPWIIGNAGLWNTIGIVLVAHIISITTGLSVSSIATDKKVKAGGTYYMISRSLGLPIGGTLGLALAVGLAFSVSLYIIGFSESFLNYWGFEIVKNNIRIAGTIALLVVTIVTFISTALALKSQFYILGAIVLSLVSIFLGNHEFTPETPLLFSISDAAPWMILFGIFFPAVTGFEAGVSMSGDLQDPKKSIPVGTITAIAVGLIVYIGLTVYFAYTVSSDALINNPKVLLEIAFWPPAVIAGIWSATISSALGSILASPRILQAAATDRIVPKIFAKGHGKGNEPRNALMMTFVIAEMGILVGELDLIARIVSMFFITTYGFLNLSCALEYWASTDFRPDFKISPWISITGSLACFLVMILLDFLAMVGATIVLGGLFLFLKRKELTLESGDTWEGVWSSVVRAGLQRLHQSIQHQRNWRPNIILFSGGNSARPHLVALGESLVRKRGILSNFELVENPQSENPITKLEPTSIEPDSQIPGIFSRRLECRNIYEGMETVTQIYGFSGIEPNTVMLGWARNSRNPEKFAHLVAHFRKMDYNVLLLDYDTERGFGEKQRIDLWWRGGSNNATLALNMLKFLKSSENWEDAEARILVVVENNALVNRVQQNLSRILEDERLDTEIKVINNAVDKLPIHEIIKFESSEADLVMIGIPPITDKNAKTFITQTDAILQSIGSTLIIGASSYFETRYVGIESSPSPAEIQEATGEWYEWVAQLPGLNLPGYFNAKDDSHQHLRKTLESLDQQAREAVRVLYENTLLSIDMSNREFSETLQALITRNFSAIEKHLSPSRSVRLTKLLSRVQTNFFFHSRQALRNFKDKIAQEQSEILQTGLAHLVDQMEQLGKSHPEGFLLYFEPDAMRPQAGDSGGLQWFKFRKRVQQRFTKKPISIKVNLTAIWRYYLFTQFYKTLIKQLQEFGVASYRTISERSHWLNNVRDVLAELQNNAQTGQLNGVFLSENAGELINQLQEITQNQQKYYWNFSATLLREARQLVQFTSESAFQLDSPRSIANALEIPKSAIAQKQSLLAIPETWMQNLVLMNNYALMDLHLMSLQHRLGSTIQKIKEELLLKIKNIALDRLDSIETELDDFLKLLQQNGNTGSFKPSPVAVTQFNISDLADEFRKNVRSAISELPESITILSEESFQKVGQQQFEGLETVEISLQRLGVYLVETRLVEPIVERLQKVPVRLRESQVLCGEVNRLVSYNLADIEATEITPENSDEPLLNIIETGLARLREEKQKLHEMIDELSEFINHQRESAFSKMNSYIAVRDGGKLGQYIRTKEGLKVLSEVGEGRQRIQNFVNNQLVKLFYRRSEGVLFARKLWKAETTPLAPVDCMLQLVESVSPRPDVLEAIPPFYRQLFLGKQVIGNDFWVGRKKELGIASQLFNRYRSGYYGAILVLGERESGKTALCRQIAKQHFQQNIFHLFAPDAGSSNPTDFLKHLQDAVQIKAGGTTAIFNSIPAKSVLIINDLELWWDRSTGGFAVIDEIVRLINTFSDDCLFIINANTHSYHLLSQLKPIDEVFIGVIECEPFAAEDLQNAILLRHQSTGLQFVFNQEIEDSMFRVKLARLFNRFFNFSSGNIGFALRSWISHVEKAEKERLILRQPERPSAAAFDALKPEWAYWLFQIVLHKHLSVPRLTRLFNGSPQDTEEMLLTLRRAGLVVVNHGAWEINPFIYPFLVEKLQEMELL